MKKLGDLIRKRKSGGLVIGGRKDVGIDEKTIAQVLKFVAQSEVKRLDPEDIQSVYYKKNTLIVVTSGSVVSQEIWLRREAIIRGVNEIFKKKLIVSIKMR